MKTLKAMTFTLGLVLAAGAIWLFSGVYDIGADAPHWPATEWLIGKLRDRSMEARSEALSMPRLDDPAMIAKGAAHYDEMCVGCHLSPGAKDNEFREGLYPQPPKLADPWPSDPRRQFWAIKHGIKMTAMPAWGKSHDDDTIWAIVAFLQKLQGMTPEQYAAATAKAGESPAGSHHH
jgi:mono/diheme cytochrome c family protein